MCSAFLNSYEPLVWPAAFDNFVWNDKSKPSGTRMHVPLQKHGLVIAKLKT